MRAQSRGLKSAGVNQAAFDVVQSRCHVLGNLESLVEVIDQIVVLPQQGVVRFDTFGHVGFAGEALVVALVLVEDFNENLEIANDMAARLEDIESCLIYASTLEAARLCAQ